MKDQEEKQDDQDIRTLNKASIAEALIAQIPELARPGRNLKTGETVTITERRVVTFHPSGTLNARVTTNLIPPQEQPRTRRTRAVLKDKE